MATKPSAEELGAAEAMRQNPNYGKDVLEAIINETPELAQSLLAQGLVEEVKNA